MSFDLDDAKAIEHLPKTLRYKVSGNSIVVDVLEDIISDLQKQNLLLN